MPLLLLLAVATAITASPAGAALAATSCAEPTTAAGTVQRALRLCDAAPVEDIFQLTTALRSAEAETAAAQALRARGLETALDLRLLGGGPEASELMASLKEESGMSIGDRSKIRLLIGDAAHLSAILLHAANAESVSQLARVQPPHDRGVSRAHENTDAGGVSRHRRRQQSDGDSETLSMDTIAIVLSVLVGAAGYLVQVGAGFLIGFVPSRMHAFCV